jgi:hypothetical protein
MNLVELLATADTQRIGRRPTPVDIEWARKVLATPAGREIAAVWEAVHTGTDVQAQVAMDHADAQVRP